MMRMPRKLARAVSIGVWALFLTFCGTAYYVNYHMPHGPFYDTGDVVCENDDRGPCREQYKEDTRAVPIPQWAKLLRDNFNLLFMGLLLAAILFSAEASVDKTEH
jgi:hypothetical protein